MPTKISKSDQTPETDRAYDEAWEAFKAKRTAHFTPGSYVRRLGERGLVLSSGDGMMLVQWEDETTEIVRVR